MKQFGFHILSVSKIQVEHRCVYGQCILFYILIQTCEKGIEAASLRLKFSEYCPNAANLFEGHTHDLKKTIAFLSQFKLSLLTQLLIQTRLTPGGYYFALT